MKRILLVCTFALTMLIGAKAQNVPDKQMSGGEFIKGLKGSYIELFSKNTCLSTEYDDLWKSETLKYIDSAKADSVIAAIQGMCQGKRIGTEAIAYNKQNNNMQFCCSFLQGVSRFEIRGNRIAGYDSNKKLIFSHKYKFIEVDGNGNYIFESVDGNLDEFRYFWFMPDSPKSTYHIEFRYGSDKSQLSKMTEGKYAFWMAAGVREGHEEEWRNGIILFIDERLKNE